MIQFCLDLVYLPSTVGRPSAYLQPLVLPPQSYDRFQPRAWPDPRPETSLHPFRRSPLFLALQLDPCHAPQSRHLLLLRHSEEERLLHQQLEDPCKARPILPEVRSPDWLALLVETIPKQDRASLEEIHYRRDTHPQDREHYQPQVVSVRRRSMWSLLPRCRPSSRRECPTANPA